MRSWIASVQPANVDELGGAFVDVTSTTVTNRKGVPRVLFVGARMTEQCAEVIDSIAHHLGFCAAVDALQSELDRHFAPRTAEAYAALLNNFIDVETANRFLHPFIPRTGPTSGEGRKLAILVVFRSLIAATQSALTEYLKTIIVRKVEWVWHQRDGYRSSAVRWWDPPCKVNAVDPTARHIASCRKLESTLTGLLGAVHRATQALFVAAETMLREIEAQTCRLGNRRLIVNVCEKVAGIAAAAVATIQQDLTGESAMPALAAAQAEEGMQGPTQEEQLATALQGTVRSLLHCQEILMGSMQTCLAETALPKHRYVWMAATSCATIGLSVLNSMVAVSRVANTLVTLPGVLLSNWTGRAYDAVSSLLQTRNDKFSESKQAELAAFANMIVDYHRRTEPNASDAALAAAHETAIQGLQTDLVQRNWVAASQSPILQFNSLVKLFLIQLQGLKVDLSVLEDRLMDAVYTMNPALKLICLLIPVAIVAGGSLKLWRWLCWPKASKWQKSQLRRSYRSIHRIFLLLEATEATNTDAMVGQILIQVCAMRAIAQDIGMRKDSRLMLTADLDDIEDIRLTPSQHLKVLQRIAVTHQHLVADEPL